MAKYTKCVNSECPNYGKIATHRRSDTPKICGWCRKPVEFIICPDCESVNIVKKGFVYYPKRKRQQRFLCLECGRQFSVPIEVMEVDV